MTLLVKLIKSGGFSASVFWRKEGGYSWYIVEDSTEKVFMPPSHRIYITPRNATQAASRALKELVKYGY